MKDGPEQNGGEGEGFAMTLVSVNQGYWIHEGDDLLNDLLFCRGAYPFRVCVRVFEDTFGLNRYLSGDGSIATMWQVNPQIIERLRKEELLIEIFSTDD
jgi:hypothetical protein